MTKPSPPNQTKTSHKPESNSIDMSNAMKYRADIDGLRAIAVIAVVFYHLGIPGFGGGYVGVDIFFTISGYLIGSIIFQHLNENRFSFTSFYIRRIRRLFPAYLFTALITSILSYWLLLPTDFREFGQSLIASTLYVPNILFYMEAGYFDSASHLKPLLHTWSLAIEEQFYFVFPVLAWILFKWSKKLVIPTFSILCVASLLAASIFVHYDQSAVFYLYPFRAWEMFIGILTASRPLPKIHSLTAANIMAFIGLALLILPISLYNNETLFPGYAALAPCIGTLLLIFSGTRQKNLVSQLLSTTPLTFTGKISYSLYLWHWPLFVLYNYTLEEPMALQQSVILFLVILAVSVFSWRYIETPFRSPKKPWLKRNSTTFSLTAIASIFCIMIGFGIYRTDGLPSRLDPEVAQLATLARGFVTDWSGCTSDDKDYLPGVEHCSIGNPKNSDNLLLVWGDSHAASIKEGLRQLAGKYNQDALIIWRGGCPPTWDIEKQESASSRIEDKNCTLQNNSVQELIDTNKSIKAVILIGRWSYYLNGGGTGIDSLHKISLSSTNKSVKNTDQKQLFLNAFEKTIKTLTEKNIKVYIVEQFPEFSDYHSRSLAKAIKNGSASYLEGLKSFSPMSYGAVLQRQAYMQNFLHQGGSEVDFEVLPTHRYFCDPDSCSITLDDLPAFYDNNHIAPRASLKINKLFLPAIKFMEKQKNTGQ
jgi:peptidoglycan/LPS O-acetylase OafA/YrhL